MVFGRPHKKLFDLLRSMCLEIGLLYILIMRFVEIRILAEYVDFDNVIYPLLAYIEYGLYGLAILMSVLSLIYHFLKKFSSNKIANDKEKKRLALEANMNDSMRKMETQKKEEYARNKEKICGMIVKKMSTTLEETIKKEPDYPIKKGTDRVWLLQKIEYYCRTYCGNKYLPAVYMNMIQRTRFNE